jgi:adenylyltransferase/sulfurtransferase
MADQERYARHIALAEVGVAGQAKLSAATMLIVGIGGLGCPAAQYLASSGVGTLLLNDFDRVDLSNLPRQILFSAADIGLPKVTAAAAALERLNPSVTVETLNERLTDAALAAAVARADVVLDCTDNFGARLAINRAAVQAAKPLVSGAALRFEGQLSVFENGAGEPCYRCLYSDDDELLGDYAGNGVLAPIPGVIGALMASEALQLVIAGHSALNGQLKLWDAISGSWQTIRLQPNPACPVCSKKKKRGQSPFS